MLFPLNQVVIVLCFVVNAIQSNDGIKKRVMTREIDCTKLPIEQYLEGIIYSTHGGYGFIRFEYRGKSFDAFYHYKDIKDFESTFLHRGNRVKFMLISTEKGLRAKNIQKIE